MTIAEPASAPSYTNAAAPAVLACRDALAGSVRAGDATVTALGVLARAAAVRAGRSEACATALLLELAPRPLHEPLRAPLAALAEARARAQAELVLEAAGADRAGALGDAYEALLRADELGGKAARKKRGSYYTPAPLARDLVARTLGPLVEDFARGARRVVVDPAMGPGRFLLEARRLVPADALHGMDTDAVAVWLARVALALACPEAPASAALCARLRHGDALRAGAWTGVVADAVVGNPPWVAHAGRQSVALADAVRDEYRARFRAFSGFPSTHGMFVELAAGLLAPGGRLGLLLPTQVADLRGYGPTRAALSARARVEQPVEELGFGRFAGVTEPTLALLATADASATASDAPWLLAESAQPAGRTRAHPALSARARAVLARLADLPRFPPETFGEAGFQTAGELTRTHLAPWPPPDARFTLALREGRDVEPFHVAPPSRALDPDPSALARAGTRLRSAESYARVAVVIRQTARFPIAAVHDPPHAFRNSLLAGYTDAPHALAALLNSALLRALHLASQRDGRQAVFPQLKVAHLRALPAPPAGRDLAALESLARRAQAAQRERVDAGARFELAVGASDLAQGLFRPEGASVPARTESLGRALGRARLRNERAVHEAFERALAETRAAHGDYVAALAALDAEVFALYDVPPDALRDDDAGGVSA